ncbi:MAG: hypothetical protein KJO11_01180 [Gemmatimonadetes bacterium]|nr:hypothetical protein [Gemmatimonadota bacterium]MBT8402421.1 hypothetical protein [Gemmatimonadota bacterium]NNF37889.1 hypothetical protein [Gemmatimonadota bacterium]NNK64135.1 hypothetical protein [Gemmatimonadota bacterium]
MRRRILRTLLVGAISGAALALVGVPALDAMGRLLLMPPVYYPAARVLLAALWAVGLASAWTYRPPEGVAEP